MLGEFKIISDVLLSSFRGYYSWWPYLSDKSEIVISSILAQNTSWKNVLVSLSRINSILGTTKLYSVGRLSINELSDLIKPTGFSKRKAHTLIEVAKFIFSKGGYWKIKSFFEKLSPKSYFLFLRNFRDDLLKIKGVGQETADSILLYSFELPSFVVDSYTVRIINRALSLNFDKNGDYAFLKETFERIMFSFTSKRKFRTFVRCFINNLKVLHAGFVEIGKNFCNKANPKCFACHLKSICKYNISQKIC